MVKLTDTGCTSPSSIHKYTNGVCTRCGAPEPAKVKTEAAPEYVVTVHKAWAFDTMEDTTVTRRVSEAEMMSTFDAALRSVVSASADAQNGAVTVTKHDSTRYTVACDMCVTTISVDYAY